MKRWNNILAYSGLTCGVSLVLVALLALTACAQNNRAPVEERGSRLERPAPLIIESGTQLPSAAARPSTPNTQPDSRTSGATAVAVPLGGGIVRRSLDEGVSASAQNNTGTAPSGVSVASTTPRYYQVARGDTLYSIAWMHNLDYRRLALANDLSPPYTIYPGQRLTLNEQGVSDNAVNTMPVIPAAPAGESPSVSGQRPRAASEGRRTSPVAARQVDGVSWQWPVEGQVLSRFNASGSSRGIDIAGGRGQPVYAAADGDVVYAGAGIQGAGNLVILRHSARHLSAYMHNSTVLVSEGASVRGGDRIAEVGNGPDGREMLHFEVRVDGKPVDPMGYLPGR